MTEANQLKKDGLDEIEEMGLWALWRSLDFILNLRQGFVINFPFSKDLSGYSRKNYKRIKVGEKWIKETVIQENNRFDLDWGMSSEDGEKLLNSGNIFRKKQ